VKESITAADCRKCGACCVAPYEQDTFCDVTPEDEERLGKKFVRLNVLNSRAIDILAAAIDGANYPSAAIKTKWRESKVGTLKGYRFNTCIALRGSVMHKVSCDVYEDRPRACREAVKPGDRTCREIRRTFKSTIEDLRDVER
jgi:Fe-S-cluster containining protein